MPVQKRSSDSGGGVGGENDDGSSHSPRKQSRHGGMDAGEGNRDEVDDDEEQKKKKITTPPPPPLAAPKQEPEPCGAVEKADSDSVQAQELLLPENVCVDLHEIRKEVQCPICLGIIKRTRTMMECLHRFCRECIDKSMRLGNNECPACRTHCASRRSLRDDPRYDELIAALFPDISKFEEEELAFGEEDKSRNEQIQASIAQIFQRQTEALGKKRGRKSTGSPSTSRPRRNSRGTPSRRSSGRRSRTADVPESDDSDDIAMVEALFSASGERSREINPDSHRFSSGLGSSHSLSPAPSSEGGLESNAEQKREKRSRYSGLMGNIEMRAWGKGGARSNTRQGNVNGSSDKKAQSARLAKFVESLRNSIKDDDKNSAPRTPVEAENADSNSFHNNNDRPHFSPDVNDKNQLSCSVNQQDADNQRTLPILKERETFAGFEANGISHGSQLILAYQQKETL